MSEIVLWDYPKSSASYRVRIALNLAGLAYRKENVNLLDASHLSEAHMGRNPQGFVPVLDIDGLRLTQSLAMLEYLETTREMGLLPQDPATRAKAQALAMVIAVDVHPVCNVSVAARATGGQDPARTEWMQHFIAKGLTAFEALLGDFEQSPFATGKSPGLADLCLAPQLYNAKRWNADYSNCPRITALEAIYAAHPAFQAAHPDV